MSRGIIIFGAGGHGKVVIDALLASGQGRILGVVDDRAAELGPTYYGYPLLGGSAVLEGYPPEDADVVVAIARNDVRKTLVTRFREAGYTVPSVIHPRAWISPTAQVGGGAMIMAQGVVNADARIGDSVVVNTGAIVEHDDVVGDFVHLGPGSRMAGKVTVEEGAFLGLGASVREFTTVGAWAMVGAGAVVIRSVPPGETVAGVPARTISQD